MFNNRWCVGALVGAIMLGGVACSNDKQVRQPVHPVITPTPSNQYPASAITAPQPVFATPVANPVVAPAPVAPAPVYVATAVVSAPEPVDPWLVWKSAERGSMNRFEPSGEDLVIPLGIRSLPDNASDAQAIRCLALLDNISSEVERAKRNPAYRVEVSTIKVEGFTLSGATEGRSSEVLYGRLPWKAVEQGVVTNREIAYLAGKPVAVRAALVVPSSKLSNSERRTISSLAHDQMLRDSAAVDDLVTAGRAKAVAAEVDARFTATTSNDTWR